jgi:acetolactate synthase-1/2/3 large subunit
VQVDIDQAILDKGTLRDPIKINMDAKEFIKQLYESTIPQKKAEWFAWMKQLWIWKAKYPVCLPEYREGGDYVNTYHFIDTLSDLALPDDIIVTDMGMAFQCTHQAWKTKKGQRLLTNCGLAPMGWGLPAAVGASFATGRRVLCIVGDGGLMMNLQELATIAHNQLNIKIFVLNNDGYSTIKQTQQLGFDGRLMGVNSDTGLSFPDFRRVFKAHGRFSVRITEPSYIRKGITLSLHTASHPFLCELMIDPNQPQAPRSLNRRNPDGTMNPTKLEDSYPFLPPEEVAEQMRIAQ